MPKPRVVNLSVRIPPNCTDEETVEYCLSALNSWGGGLRPEDDFFDGVKATKAESSANKFVLTSDEYHNVLIQTHVAKGGPHAPSK
jgi:hypothetical protein